MRRTHTVLLTLSAMLLLLPAVGGASECDVAPGTIATRALLAGQTMPAGHVEVAVKDSNLCVKYVTNDDWHLKEIHLYIGTTAPTKSAPGQFPYKVEGLHSSVEEICVPLADIGACCGDCVFIAAHAVVEACDDGGRETAWACGPEIRPGKSWAMYFSVTLPCENNS